MRLHVFNPDHEMALAANLHQFTSPRAGREMRSYLSFLPALWANDGDAVWVEDVENAHESLERIGLPYANIVFATAKDILQLSIDSVYPWGWDRSIVHQLKRLQVSPACLPTDEQLTKIREISSRQWTSIHLLPVLNELDERVIGEADYVTSLSSFTSPVVFKSPWSCSGRGVRYALNEQQFLANQNWAKNIIEKQGGIMVEPYYQHSLDFAMEFESNAKGIKYLGISLFLTNLGGYTGNILASEKYKLQVISRYISLDVLENVKTEILKQMNILLKDKYLGPFGVDMMVVKDGQHYRLHPCVELNLRRTMGHVALSIQSKYPNPMMMCVKYDGSYRLEILPIEKNECEILT